MSNLRYYTYEGFGERSQQQFWYSQAVRIGDRIECAGQGTRNRSSLSPHTLTILEHRRAGSEDKSLPCKARGPDRSGICKRGSCSHKRRRSRVATGLSRQFIPCSLGRFRHCRYGAQLQALDAIPPTDLDLCGSCESRPS